MNFIDFLQKLELNYLVCSKCEKQFNAKSDEFKNQKNEDETAE